MVASNPTSNSIHLGWTATGDDGLSGTAALQQVRYGTSPITEAGFFLGIRATNVPAPAAPGQPQSMTVGGLTPNTTYHFRMKGYDEWGNGPLSNATSCKTQGVCTASFCLSEGTRCTYTGCGGCNGCCGYSCAADPTCVEPEECPLNTCPGVPCY